MKTEFQTAIIPLQDRRVAWQFTTCIVSGNHRIRRNAIHIMQTIKDKPTLQYIRALVYLVTNAEINQNQHNN